MFKTSIRIHAYILLFPLFTGISVTEATAQTVSTAVSAFHRYFRDRSDGTDSLTVRPMPPHLQHGSMRDAGG